MIGAQRPVRSDPSVPPSPVDTTPPVISNVVVSGITETTASVEWNLNEGATGRVYYGTSTAYGQQTNLETNYLTYHKQNISGLSSATQYFYEIHSYDAAGNLGVHSGSFSTLGAAPQPVQSVVSTFGPAIAASSRYNSSISSWQSKQNIRIVEGAIALRFTARQSGKVSNIRFQMTNRTTSYGIGDGGKYRIGLKAVDANGKPTGDYLGVQSNGAAWVDYSPGIITSPENFGVVVNFSNGFTTTSGQTYCLMIENVHSNPTANYSSFNAPWNPMNSIHPYWSEEENVSLLNGSSGYGTAYDFTPTMQPPCFDLAYTSGFHEGFTAIRAAGEDSYRGYVKPTQDSAISWTHFGDSINFNAVNVYMFRVLSSANAQVTVKVNSSTVATGTFTTSSSLAAGTSGVAWCRAALSSSVSISSGDTVQMLITTSSGEYGIQTLLLRDSGTTTANHMQSFPYVNGSNPFRADTGGSPAWSSWYSHTTYMFYVEVVKFPDVVDPVAYEPLVTATVPSYLGTHACSHQSGTTEIARVTNTDLTRNRYSSIAAWNIDQSMLAMGRGNTGSKLVLDGSDYSVLASGTNAEYTWSLLWSNQDPLIGWNRSTNLLRKLSVNPATGVYTQIHTDSPSHTDVDFGAGQGCQDNFDRYISYSWRDSNGNYGIGVWDLQTRSSYAERQIGTGAGSLSAVIDHTGMSQTGQWMNVSFIADGTGYNQGMWMYEADLNTTTRKQARTQEEHWDWGRSANGTDLFVYWTSSGVQAFNPNTNITTTHGPSNILGNTHISCRNVLRPGWALVSQSFVGYTNAGYGQAFAVNLDDRTECMVYGFLHRTQNPGYESDTMACFSPDGTLVTWGGRWEGGTSTYGYVAGLETGI